MFQSILRYFTSFPQVWDLTFSFLELYKDFVDSFLQSESLRMAAHSSDVSPTPPSFVSSAKGALYRPLMKTLCSINSRVILQMTDLDLELMPLITTLWVLQFSQYSIYPTVHWFCTYFISLSTKMLWETALKANIDNTHYSLFLHYVTHMISS